MSQDLDLLSRLVGEPVLEVSALSGGCIARSSRVVTARRTFFAKSGRGRVAEALEAEEDGLRFLRSAVGDDGLLVPDVVASVFETPGHPALLVLEWIESASWDRALWDHLGRSLAALHRVIRPRYGHHRDNFIGRLPQLNTEAEDWPGFVLSMRLDPQVRRAREAGLWSPDWNRRFEVLSRGMEGRLPRRPPASVLHGDLWSGNVMPTTHGRAAAVDPAVYAGDRESDVAMTSLFGGFDRRFYEAYQEEWPMDPGWEDRLPVYRLYHLVNHLNHFGSGYAGAVDRTLRELT